MRSTYNHPAKHCFLVSEAKHVIIIGSMLPYSSSYMEFWINGIRTNIPNIHNNIHVPDVGFAFHVQRSTDTPGSYIVVSPGGETWADMAFLAPNLHANNLLEIGVVFEENCFLILQYVLAYDKFVIIKSY